MQIMRRLGVMIGSDSDLPQCREGFLILKEAEAEGKAQVIAVITNSIHRNMMDVLRNLRALTCPDREKNGRAWVNVWIIGAGWANQLTGMSDSYLRYIMLNDFVPVIGVAFEGNTPQRTQAAILSILEVPGSQVIFDPARHVGSRGFAHACNDAVYGDLPKLILPKPKLVEVRNLDAAIMEAEAKARQSIG